MATALKARGTSGEGIAARFLSALGYKILNRNFRCREGEIDLVARDGGCLVFIEVKTRSSLSFGSGAEAVTFPKRRKMEAAARYFIFRHNLTRVPCRFDVVSVLLCRGRRPLIDVIHDAFSEGE